MRWYVLLAVAVVLTANLFGGPQVTKDQHASTNATRDHSKNSQQIVPPTHVIIDPPFPTVNSQSIPTTRQNDTKQKPLPWFIKFTKPEWVIVYVTALYSLIAGLTLSTIKRQADLMERQTKAAEDSSKAAIKAANAAETALHVVERATLTILIENNVVTPTSQQIQTFINIKNVGRTTAFVKQVEGALAIRHGEGHPPASSIDKPDGDLPSLYGIPSSDNKRIIATSDTPPGKMTEVLESKVKLYVIGKIVYDDEFRKRHVTTFGFLYDPVMNQKSGGFAMVNDPGYNYTD